MSCFRTSESSGTDEVLTLLVARLQLLDGCLNVLHATLLSHLLCGEVGVQTSTVPVTGHGLGCHGDAGAENLSDAVEQETGNPELVTHCDALARTDLELPLGGHDLGVGAGDVDASVQACLVVCLDDVTLDDLAGTDTAVVGTLGSRETVGRLFQSAIELVFVPHVTKNKGTQLRDLPSQMACR